MSVYVKLQGVYYHLGGGFKHFYFQPEPWGRWTHFDEHIFQGGLVQPPTSYINNPYNLMPSTAPPCSGKIFHPPTSWAPNKDPQQTKAFFDMNWQNPATTFPTKTSSFETSPTNQNPQLFPQLFPNKHPHKIFPPTKTLGIRFFPNQEQQNNTPTDPQEVAGLSIPYPFSKMVNQTGSKNMGETSFFLLWFRVKSTTHLDPRPSLPLPGFSAPNIDAVARPPRLPPPFREVSANGALPAEMKTRSEGLGDVPRGGEAYESWIEIEVSLVLGGSSHVR